MARFFKRGAIRSILKRTPNPRVGRPTLSTRHYQKRGNRRRVWRVRFELVPKIRKCYQFEVSSNRLSSMGWQCRVTQFGFNINLCRLQSRVWERAKANFTLRFRSSCHCGLLIRHRTSIFAASSISCCRWLARLVLTHSPALASR